MRIIYDNAIYNVRNLTINDLSAELNDWRTVDPEEIEAKIWDYGDNPDVGIVDFLPLCIPGLDLSVIGSSISNNIIHISPTEDSNEIRVLVIVSGADETLRNKIIQRTNIDTIDISNEVQDHITIITDVNMLQNRTDELDATIALGSDSNMLRDRTVETNNTITLGSDVPVPLSIPMVTIAVYSDLKIVGSVEIPLLDGEHEVGIHVNESSYSSENVSVIVDPDNHYLESNEENNTVGVRTLFVEEEKLTILQVPSPCAGFVTCDLLITESYAVGIRLGLYSVDGRLIDEIETDALSAGVHRFSFGLGSEQHSIPSGCYFLRVEGYGEEHVRRVVVLN